MPLTSTSTSPEFETSNTEVRRQSHLLTAIAPLHTWLAAILLSTTALLIPASTHTFSQALQALLLQNNAYALLLSLPIATATLKYTSSHHNGNIPSALIGALLTTFLLSIPLILHYHLNHPEIPIIVRMNSIAQYFLLCSLWSTVPVLTTAKHPFTALGCLILGLATTYILTTWDPHATINTHLSTINTGLAITLCSMLAWLFAQHAKRFSNPFAFIAYSITHWKTPLSALMMAAILILMLHVPQSHLLPITLALLSAIPALYLGLTGIHRNSMPHYQTLLEALHTNAPYNHIKKAQQRFNSTLTHNLSITAILQGCLSITIFLLSTHIAEKLDFTPEQTQLLQCSIITALFLSFTLLAATLLWLVQSSSKTLLILTLQCIAIVATTPKNLTAASIFIGILALTLLSHHVRRLDYHAFSVQT